MYRRDKCRCDVCREANAKYSRDKRAKERGEDPAAAVMQLQLPLPSDSVEAAIRTELASYTATALRPGLTKLLLAMARVIDDPRARAQHASVARQIQLGLERIRSQSVTRRHSSLYGDLYLKG